MPAVLVPVGIGVVVAAGLLLVLVLVLNATKNRLVVFLGAMSHPC